MSAPHLCSRGSLVSPPLRPVGFYVFEETAGLVPLKLLRAHGAVVGAELKAPEMLSRRTIVSREAAAACLSLDPGDIAMEVHAPQVASVGLPFLIVAVRNREVLRRSTPNIAAHARLLPLEGADAIFAYCRATDEASASVEAILHARTFSPLDGIVEDPATGSACAAAIALLATLEAQPRPERAWRIHQGVDMGRPSLLLGRTTTRGGEVIATHIGGRCVAVLEGTLDL